MSERIDRIEVHYLQIPLTKPYRLSFGPVEHYDTIVVELIDSVGRYGFGEATLLTGYTDETIAGSWALARELARELTGLPIAAFTERLRRAHALLLNQSMDGAAQRAIRNAHEAPRLHEPHARREMCSRQ